MAELTQAQREQMQKDLLAMRDEVNSKMAALGMDNKTSPQTKSPDGGPTSYAHTFLRPHLYNTFRVIRKNPDGTEVECVVNDEMFDSATMTRIEDAVRRPRVVQTPAEATRTAPQPVKKPLRMSNASKDDMLVMTMTQLRALPEVDYIDELPDRKADLVDAILDVRESAGQ